MTASEHPWVEQLGVKSQAGMQLVDSSTDCPWLHHSKLCNENDY